MSNYPPGAIESMLRQEKANADYEKEYESLRAHYVCKLREKIDSSEHIGQSKSTALELIIESLPPSKPEEKTKQEQLFQLLCGFHNKSEVADLAYEMVFECIAIAADTLATMDMEKR